MNVEAVVAYCLAKPGAEETYPFGEHVLVAKVGGKGFAFIGQDEPGTIAVKCGATKDEAAELRARYPGAVSVMDYLGRYGWNRVELGAGVPDAELEELIDASYEAIVRRLPKAKRP
ncbi:MmcQ/YjbR family DNA-binding protein [Amycolatopsis tolypomycina]|uniref:Predicted DNA-binding protein, MmcQ/YjbR family n=1 Tax=Amycolatopsis tolypomycina TaxID=208445 RepID=A0A1H4YSI1_9PSEU|nr:MmcQ/YjbR family DNA-binding protein [Amycolatopsis tolypomycina]SED20615.1 Predicted DNA-binding protein, MmcQ/YjbR family [Amycolatopsis tolypomycina]